MSSERAPAPPSMTDLATEVIFDIGQSIVASVGAVSTKWRSCYVRAERRGHDLGLNYFYFEDMTEDNKQLFAMQDKFAFYDHMMELAETTRSPEGNRWKVCLCRIQKAVGTVDVSFEFKDPQRWRSSHLD